MSAIWKLLGAAAALAGLAPYKVNKDEETGEVKVKALLWNATYAPATEEKSKTVDVHFGLNVPGKEKEDETHIYTDDVTVSYAAEEKAGENAEAAPEAAEEKAEEAAPAAEAVEQKVEEAAQAAETVAEKAEEVAEAVEAVEEKVEEAAEAVEAAEEKVEEAAAEPEKPAEE